MPRKPAVPGKVTTRLDLRLTDAFYEAVKAYAEEQGIAIAEVFRQGAAELMGRPDLRVRPRGEQGHSDVIRKAKRPKRPAK